MDEIQTMVSEGLSSAAAGETAGAVQPGDGGTGTAPLGTERTTGTDASQAQNVQGGGTPPAGDITQHPEFVKLAKEREESAAKLSDFEKKMSSMNEQLLQFQRPVQPAVPETPSRDFDKELAEIDSQLESGDLSVVEANTKQRAILREQYRTEAGQLFQDAVKGQNMTALQQAFLKDNPDYLDFVRTGKAREIQGKTPWGGLHDEVSAFYAHKFDSVLASKDAEIKAAVEKAVSETVKKKEDEFRAKGHARTLGQGPTTVVPNQETDPRLKDPKKFGGMRSVLQARLAERRAQQK